MNRLFLIDGMSLVFRAYHAMIKQNFTTPKGEPSGAVFGFANIISSFLENEKPEFAAVVFDVREPTFRHKMYPNYKANRLKFPEELEPQLPKIKQMIELMGFPQYEKPGFEADDIIGTLAKKTACQNKQVFCLTNDKDYLQLVEDNIKILKPLTKGDFEILGAEGVYDKFGVKPDQVIDVLALMGDTSDNIPGVKGIGEKTAIPLIQQYGSIDGLYQNLDLLPQSAAKNKLINDKEMAYLSRTLVTIDTDVPIEFTLDDLKLKQPDFQRLNTFFKDEGFTQLRLRWLEKSKQFSQSDLLSNDFETEDATEVKQYKNIKDINKEYILVDTEDELFKMKAYLESRLLFQNQMSKNPQDLCFDLETSSLDVHSCEIVGIAIAIESYKAFYIATNEGHNRQIDLFNVATSHKAIELPKVLNVLKPFFENASIGKIGQNAKFDALILKRHDVNVYPISFDTMLASYLRNPDSRHNMDDLARELLDYSPISISALIGEKKKDQKSMKDINPVDILDYAAEDAAITFQLKQKLYEMLELNGLLNLAEKVEFPLITPLINMELAGIALNISALNDLSIKLTLELEKLTKQIFDEAGVEFNIESPKQLGHILFEKLMIPPTKKTKTGFSTDVTVLTDLAPFYPIAEYLLEFRSFQKLKSTYIDSLPKLINPVTNRVHTTFNQTIAGTGRLTSTDPNLQNIPIRTDLGREIRKAFIARDNDHLIFAADYSQIELRIMAYICGDLKMIESFQAGLDIHAATAALLFNKQVEDVNKDERRTAKTVNFGIMYGLGSFGLSSRLKISIKEAKDIIDNYFDK